MLQIGPGLFYCKLRQTLLQIETSVVTNWGSYYKLGQPLLQNKAAITIWGKMYYKNILQFLDNPINGAILE